MQHEIFDNGQLNVEITNVKASDEEIEKLKACIAKASGAKMQPRLFSWRA